MNQESRRRDGMTRRDPRVLLRGLVAADADLIAAWSRDKDFCRAAGWSIRPMEQHRAFQRQLIADPPVDLLRLAATRDGHLVGYVDLHGSAPDRRELGFLVGPREVWGQGLGMAAASAGLRYGFHELGLKEIWAEALEANHASIRILQKLGMTGNGWGEVDTHLGRPSRYRQFSITAK
ncbi:MAG: GNAT family N-acetyltransferase [Ornithinimicrobium sp.]|uniref:GNAT family N-acetyltransferase n=1 Tax=Ornithinimicrobium sp. TaxID=1977084 RepID=UPI0026E00812|nr:GNAT family N-acetyltransferase [Ornithinimicrobium sp.]MDO5740638.1 GNAT family N-acetyltransferase [Ornithinimicrobium sp.]